MCSILCRLIFLLCMFCVFWRKITPPFVQHSQIVFLRKVFRKNACIFFSGVLRYNHQIKLGVRLDSVQQNLL